MANFGASENCSLLLCVRMLQFKTREGGKGASRHTQRGACCLSVCQIPPLSFGNLFFNILAVLSYFSLHFKKLNDACLQEEVIQKQQTP